MTKKGSPVVVALLREARKHLGELPRGCLCDSGFQCASCLAKVIDHYLDTMHPEESQQ